MNCRHQLASNQNQKEGESRSISFHLGSKKLQKNLHERFFLMIGKHFNEQYSCNILANFMAKIFNRQKSVKVCFNHSRSGDHTLGKFWYLCYF